MSWTLQEAQQMLQTWIDAEKAVATGQSYKIGSRSLQRVNLSEIRKQINFWRNEIDRIKNGRGRGARVMRAVPRDL
ncbi:head-tail adaptor [Vibrio phage vB_VpaM_XM1]